MQQPLWAPWRMEYHGKKPTEGCIFCNFLQEEKDAENLIVARGKACFVILNKYPYNSGHTMVIPNRHLGDYGALTAEEFQEMGVMTQYTITTLQQAFRSEGFNVGMNLGSVSGAGIPGHLHQHIVPRWYGDTNFMPVIAETKAIPHHLEWTYRKMVDIFKTLNVPQEQKKKEKTK